MYCKLCWLILFILLPITSQAEVQLSEQVKAKCGSLDFGNGVILSVLHYNEQWKGSTLDRKSFLPEKLTLEEMNRKWAWTGDWQVEGGRFRTSEHITSNPNGGLDINVTFNSQIPVPTNFLGLNLELPVERMGGKSITADGVPIRLPETFDKTAISSKTAIKKIVIPLNGRSLEFNGKFDLLIQDNRKFKSNVFCLRLYSVPSSGKLTESRLAVTVDFKPVPAVTIDLRPMVSTGFADQTADDQKGGWTDQGSENDLRMIKPGKKVMGGIVFDIIDPAKNQGRSCLVLAGPSREYFPVEAGIELSGKTGQYLYLLHAAAWVPAGNAAIGKIEVIYVDGSHQTIPVRNRVDVANWWNASSYSNANVVWTAENRQSYVGLLLSVFKLENRPISKISFKSGKTAVWMIVAASLSDILIDTTQNESVSYITSDNEWQPLQFPRDVKSGSALDFSGFQDAPAGKYGRAVVTPSGGIAFEKRPQERVRFYGANLCFSAQYLEHKEAEQLADTLAKMGYNSVRLHHFDTFLTAKNATRSTILNQEILEQMDYLFYCLKKRGIYVTIDLYCSRKLRDGEIPEYPVTSRYELKMLIPLFASARENWKEYVRNMICRKNPYTGLTWAEDPALFLVNVVNEDTIFTEWDKNPRIKELYKQRFQEWLKQQKLPASSDQNILFKIFLARIQADAIEECRQFLRDIKLQALVTDNNFISQPLQAGLRNRLDVVDNHEYLDHPTFPEREWSLPYGYNQRSAISAMAFLPRGMMPSRIFGKPFVVTEFNYCFPNAYRAEGGPLIGAYAGLQDWDGLYRFAWSHSRKQLIEPSVPSGFDCVSEPVSQLSDRLALLMFLRGDVAPAKQGYAWECPDLLTDLDPGNIQTNFPSSFSILGLTYRIGSTLKNTNLAPGTKRVPVDSGLWDGIRQLPAELRSDSKKAVSDTGEITINATELMFKVVTPRTEAFVINGGSCTGSVMEVNNASIFQTIAVSALDGLPLVSSRKILCFQLTDVLNTKMKFANNKHTIVEKWGELPLLLRKGKSDISLKLAGAGSFRVNALALDGTEKEELPSIYANGTLRFTVDTGFAGGTMVYLIQPAVTAR